MIRRMGLLAVVIALAAVPSIAAAKSENAGPKRDKATGGGQAFFDMRDPTGAGDTVAFTAQRARNAAEGSDDATGQVQVNRRGGSGGESDTGVVKFHGIVDCLVVNGDSESEDEVVTKGVGEAYIGGYVRGDASKRFELYVRDGGKGQMERVNDVIMLFAPGETEDNDQEGAESPGPCGLNDPDDTSVSMARGNVQVTNANTSEDQQPEAEEEQQGASTLAAPLTSLLQ